MIKVILFCAAVVAVHCLGGYEKQDVKDQHIQDLVSFASQQINARTNSIFMRKVLNVVEAERQLVNGFNYKIKFTFGQTKCNKYSTSEQVAACDLFADRDQVCTVKVYESFDQSTRELSAFSCPNKMRRALFGGIPGGISDDLTVTTDFLNDANRALSMRNSLLTDVKVIRARTQVVAGQKKYLTVQGKEAGKLTQCDIEIWSRPWLSGDEGFKVLKLDCHKVASKEKRAGGVKTESDTDQFKDIVMRALAVSNAALNDFKIVSAKTQVVAGRRIMLKITGNSDDQTNVQCSVDVWSRPWLAGDEGFKVTKFDCNKNIQKSRRSLFGGVTGGVSDDLAEPQKFIADAKKAIAKSNAVLTDIKVIKARTQVVAGQKKYLTVQGKEFGELKECDIEIWTRPWLSDDEGFQVLKFQCHKPTSKRALGGRMCAGCVSGEVDNPDQYKDLLVQAVAVANTNLDEKNLKIISVRKQVVAGIKYYMTVESSEAGEPRLCDVTFTETPWMTPSINNVNFKCKPTKKN